MTKSAKPHYLFTKSHNDNSSYDARALLSCLRSVIGFPLLTFFVLTRWRLLGQCADAAAALGRQRRPPARRNRHHTLGRRVIGRALSAAADACTGAALGTSAGYLAFVVGAVGRTARGGPCCPARDWAGKGAAFIVDSARIYVGLIVVFGCMFTLAS